jgi:hypothetical protein
MRHLGFKFFVFEFKNAGGNSVYAKSKEEALPAYRRMNGESPGNPIDETTLKELTPEEEKSYKDQLNNFLITGQDCPWSKNPRDHLK